MPNAAPADPERFEEASAWFRGRVAVTKDEWRRMTVEARRQAFTLAGTQQLEVVQTVMAELQTAIDKGTPIDKWRESIREKLGKRFTSGNATNLTTAFINANQTAYNTGRWYQMQAPEVVAALPFRRWDTVLDGNQTEICDACKNTVLPVDDPWWLTHWPPMHHRCRSTVRALTERMAKRAGGETTKPYPNITGDFGLAPPLRTPWEPDLNKYEQHAAREYTRKQKRMRSRIAERPRYRKEPPSPRLGALGEKVFGKKLSEREIGNLAGAQASLPSGYKLSGVTVKEFDRLEFVRLNGSIHDADGSVVGSFSRVFHRHTGELTAKNFTFFIDASVQKSGIGRAIFNAQIDAYAEIGVSNVELDAAQVGRYVWTKAGFEWSEESRTALLGHLRDRLSTKIADKAVDRIMSKVRTPQDVARLVVDGERVGKELLLEYPEDLVPMSQSPDKIKRL